MGYYAGMLAYYWVLATPAVGFLFGCYLYVAVNLFHCHYDEAFSALRIPHYKGFSRLHLTPSGDLVIYALAMDQVKVSKICSDRQNKVVFYSSLNLCCIQRLLYEEHSGKSLWTVEPFTTTQKADLLPMYLVSWFCHQCEDLQTTTECERDTDCPVSAIFTYKEDQGRSS